MEERKTETRFQIKSNESKEKENEVAAIKRGTSSDSEKGAPQKKIFDGSSRSPLSPAEQRKLINASPHFLGCLTGLQRGSNTALVFDTSTSSEQSIQLNEPCGAIYMMPSGCNFYGRPITSFILNMSAKELSTFKVPWLFLITYFHFVTYSGFSSKAGLSVPVNMHGSVLQVPLFAPYPLFHCASPGLLPLTSSAGSHCNAAEILCPLRRLFTPYPRTSPCFFVNILKMCISP